MEKYNAETLKPCPFCGGDAYEHAECGDVLAGCQKCEATAWKDKWNTRTQVEPVVPLSEVLELLDNERQRYYDTEENMKSFAIYDFSNTLKQKYGVSE